MDRPGETIPGLVFARAAPKCSHRRRWEGSLEWVQSCERKHPWTTSDRLIWQMLVGRAKLWTLVFALTFCRPTHSHHANRPVRLGHYVVGRGGKPPPGGLKGGAPGQNYLEKSLLQIPERGRSTSGKVVESIQSFKLMERSECHSGVAAWCHSRVALRSITPKEHSKVTMQSSTSEIHSGKMVQSENFVVREIWGTRK